MGQSKKVGKLRKDTFYYRAKESGYRSRASFKLIQLNRKYNFLQSSRVCIDLCAAPGSWTQVASKFMPISSVIIGVDRYPIAPIPNTISIQGDITTEKVKQDLKANLKTWKADLVLHDGAPNVGQNWLHDAYQQNLLVLHAFKLACDFLQKGGTFVSKVFRSKDHLSLQYVFRKLFKKVEATKPIASRFQSAEIFIVCQGFLAPDKVDPQFFDPKYVFQTLESEPKNAINVLKPEKTKKKADGYEEGVTLLFKKKLISEFIQSSNYIEILEEANEFEWDLPAARESIHTTSNIIEFCKDIKVLNRKDLRILINWRKAVKADIEKEQKRNKIQEEKPEVAEEKDEVDEELEELEKLQEEVVKLQAEQKKEEKRHTKKVDKKRKRQEEKMKLLLSVPGDLGPQETDANFLFALENINSVDTLDNIVDQGTDIMIGESSDEETEPQPKKKKVEYYSRDGANLQRAKEFGGNPVVDSDEEEESSEDEGLNIEEENTSTKKKVTFADTVSYKDDDDSEPDDDTGKTNPLLTNLVGDQEVDRREMKAEKWFSKIAFDDLEEEDLEDYEIETAVQNHEEAGGKILKKKTDESVPEDTEEEQPDAKKRKMEAGFKLKDGPDSDSDFETDEDDNDDDSDSGVNSDAEKEKDKAKEPEKQKKKKAPALSNIGLALATKMIRSKKAERDLYDEGWNRYMQGDEDLPDWFAEDERQHNSPIIKVDKEDLRMYQNENKAVDSRTIKKVVEAKARKQRRIRKRMAKARKKAEHIVRDPDMTAREKAHEMNKVYRKASSSLKPKEKKYIVMRKCFGGTKPKGQKGPTKMVDRRQKKDKRSMERAQRKKGKKIKLDRK